VGVRPSTAFASKDVDFIAITKSQRKAVTRQLDLICQTIHPTEKTLETFGHQFRNLLILANLGNLFKAISACIVSMICQFGEIARLNDDYELSLYFRLASRPEWPISEFYMVGLQTS
jgi:hypothetical protein